MKKKSVIKKTMTIEKVLSIDENLTTVLLGFGLHCFGCPMSRMETLEEAAQVHEIYVDLLIKKLNEGLNFKVKGKVKSCARVKKGTLKN